MNALKRLAAWILRREIAERDAMLKQLADPTVEFLHIDGGRFSAGFSHPWAITAIAHSLEDTLKQCGGENYVECHFVRRNGGGRITVTVQRPDGKSPHELRRDAELKVQRLELELEKLTSKL